MAEKKRILYVGGFSLPDKNAAAHRVLGIAKSLKELGYVVEFLDVSDDIVDGSLSAEWNCQGFSVHSQRHSHTTKQRIQYTSNPLHVEEILNLHNDWEYVIAYNYPALALYKLCRICHKRGIRIAADCTEWYAFDGTSIGSIITWFDSELRMRYVQKKMDGMIAISTYLESYYRKYMPIAVVPPTVDPEEKKWHQARRESERNTIEITYAGTIGNGRNKDKLNTVIHAIFESGGNLHLNIVGVSETDYVRLFPEDEALIRNCAASGMIDFLGRMSHEGTLKLIQQSDYTMFYRESTRVNNAGFPTKFVESISCGVPVITTKTSDLVRYIGNCGFLLESDQFSQQFLECVNTGTKIPDEDRWKFSYCNYTDKIEKIFRR